MNRKFFIKNAAISAFAIGLMPIANIYAVGGQASQVHLKLNAFEGNGKKVKILGKILDANTLENIEASISILKENGDIKQKKICQTSGYFSIENDLGNEFTEKLKFKISASNYEPFEGILYVSKSSVNICSNIWEYNPKFKPENMPNKHRFENGILIANFDFHLLKKG